MTLLVPTPEGVGEIAIRGHNVMKGYWGNPEATREAIDADGWFRTGDLARVDGDGCYFIVDRKKELIIRGGYNVYPREIEEVIYEHPAVREAAVVGIPHPELGEEVGAAIALKAGADVDEAGVREFVRARVAAVQVPAPRLVRGRAAQGVDGQDPQARDRGAGGDRVSSAAAARGALEILLTDAAVGRRRFLPAGAAARTVTGLARRPRRPAARASRARRGAGARRHRALAGAPERDRPALPRRRVADQRAAARACCRPTSPPPAPSTG